MFFFLAIVAMSAYALQNTLLAHHSRELDGLTTTLYRNISLVFTALPLLFFVQPGGFSLSLNVLIPSAFAGIFGSLGLICGFEATNHLPVGISKAFGRPFRIVMMGILGYYLFQETITIQEISIMVIILIGAAGLCLHKNDFEHLQDSHTQLGFLLSFLSPSFGALSVISITLASRQGDPFLVGYFWEFFIAMTMVIIAFGRYLIFGIQPKSMNWKTFKQVALDSSPTVIGTGCYVWATTLGSLAILGAIGALSIFFVTLFSWFIYHEKLRTIDLFWMTLIAVGVIGLQFATS